MRSSVVLPQPLGPRKHTNSPSWTTRDTPPMATTLPNFLATSLSSTAGGGVAPVIHAARASRPRLLRVPLRPLREDAVAVLRRPVEVVGMDDLADVLRQALGHGEAGHRDG